jgi:hypothetical protein
MIAFPGFSRAFSSLAVLPHRTPLLPLYNTSVMKRRQFLRTATAFVGAQALPQAVATRRPITSAACSAFS